jgi:hypothetical protein
VLAEWRNIDEIQNSRGKTVRTGGNAVIRQAISCDICGSEKQHTNHWFVAHDQNGELRVTGWNSRNRLRPGSKHLCGQTCLHKLLDEFMARIFAVKVQATSVEDVVHHQVEDTDASLTSDTAYIEVESSARIVAQSEPAAAKPLTPRPLQPKTLPLRASAELVAMPGRLAAEPQAVPEEAPRYTSRNWRAEAWDRERERELRAVERRPDISPRRRSGS